MSEAEGSGSPGGGEAAWGPGLPWGPFAFPREEAERLVERFRREHPKAARRLEVARRIDPCEGYSLAPFDETRSIFFHIPKTAGLSVSKALYGNSGGGHRGVVEFLVAFGPEAFERYFKFTIVRNPWDRVYSAWRFLRGGGMHEEDRRWAERHLAVHDDFGGFVKRGLPTAEVQAALHFLPQGAFLCWPGSSLPLVDYIGFFERLEESFACIAHRLGKPRKPLPRLNRSGAAPADYREAYDEESRGIVSEIYAVDVALFGYDFDSERIRRGGVPGVPPAPAGA